MNERIIITILAGMLALGVYLYILQEAPHQRRSIGVSTLLLTGILLLYYQYYIFDPSHGIGILILPLATGWLIWRRERTGKPAISALLFIAFQILFCLIFIAVVQMQER